MKKRSFLILFVSTISCLMTSCSLFKSKSHYKGFFLKLTKEELLKNFENKQDSPNNVGLVTGSVKKKDLLLPVEQTVNTKIQKEEDGWKFTGETISDGYFSIDAKSCIDQFIDTIQMDPIKEYEESTEKDNNSDKPTKYTVSYEIKSFSEGYELSLNAKEKGKMIEDGQEVGNLTAKLEALICFNKYFDIVYMYEKMTSKYSQRLLSYSEKVITDLTITYLKE